jgi:peptidoglycan/xylan/chitin deacetylase (PgdA/CDA1 family)
MAVSLRRIILVFWGVVLALGAWPAAATTPTPTPRSRVTVTPTRTPVPLPASARVPILMYHYVSTPAATADRLRRDLSVTPENFEAQLKYLKDNGFTSIRLYDLHAHLAEGRPLPEKPVVLTFDDGHIDHYVTVFPLLRKYDMTATFFVVADFATFSYTNPDYMNWAHAKEMARAGMDIESHGRSHRDVRRDDFYFLVWEIDSTNKLIEANTGHKPRFFSYPAGRYSAATLRMLRSVNTLGAVTTQHGRSHTLAGNLEWTRVRVAYRTSIDGFASLVAP